MNRALVVLALAAASTLATSALADEPAPVDKPAPAEAPGLADKPAPAQTPSLVTAPPPGTPPVTAPATLDDTPPPPPATGRMPTGHLVGGIVCLGIGGLAGAYGAVGLSTHGDGGYGDLSSANHTIGGILVGVGGALGLAGAITLLVGAAKASAPPPAVSLVPTLHLGAGTASATWQF